MYSVAKSTLTRPIQLAPNRLLRLSLRSQRNVQREYSSTMHENDPELLDLEKRRNLNNIQHRTSTPLNHAPGWNEYLASASEANLKADKCSVSVSEMQKKTVDYVKGRHNLDDRLESTTASYTKDEVEGPLSGRGSETPTHVHESATVHKQLERQENPTASEEAVKADRGEVKP